MTNDVIEIDAEDFGDILSQIETSFDIRFEDEEIQNLISIDELAEKVIAKVKYQKGFECSSQIVFYELRKLLTEKAFLDIKHLDIHTPLATIFPSNDRRRKWELIFKGFGLNVPQLEPSGFLILSNLIAIVSFFFLFGSLFKYAFPVFLSSILISFILKKTAKGLPCNTLGELADKIVKYDYLQTRKNVRSINPAEIKKIIFKYVTEWLSESEKVGKSMKSRIDYLALENKNVFKLFTD